MKEDKLQQFIYEETLLQKKRKERKEKRDDALYSPQSTHMHIASQVCST